MLTCCPTNDQASLPFLQKLMERRISIQVMDDATLKRLKQLHNRAIKAIVTTAEALDERGDTESLANLDWFCVEILAIAARVTEQVHICFGDIKSANIPVFHEQVVADLGRAINDPELAELMLDGEHHVFGNLRLT